MAECVLCGRTLADAPTPTPGARDTLRVECPACGSYDVGAAAAAALPDRDAYERALLSGVARHAHDRGDVVSLTTDSLDDLIRNARPPRDPFQAADILLAYVRRHMGRMDDSVFVSLTRDFPVVYAAGPNELRHHLRNLNELGLIEWGQREDGFDVYLTLDGWRRLDELARVSARSVQAFVAMWFDESMDPAWKDGFRPALEATGYEPLRIDLHEHNERIDERIVAEIRRSGLLVADFTGHRGGVYFEAGLALGLGIPVVWTCRADELEGSHFDTRQYNHIVWESPAVLRERLVTRIRATIGSPDARAS